MKAVLLWQTHRSVSASSFLLCLIYAQLQLTCNYLTHLSSRGRYTMHFLHCLVMCPVHMMEMCCIHVQLNLPVTCCLDTPTSSRHQSFESVKEEKWNVKDSSPQHSEAATKGFFCSVFVFGLILFTSWGTFWLNNKTEISHTYVDAHEAGREKSMEKLLSIANIEVSANSVAGKRKSLVFFRFYLLLSICLIRGQNSKLYFCVL